LRAHPGDARAAVHAQFYLRRPAGGVCTGNKQILRIALLTKRRPPRRESG